MKVKNPTRHKVIILAISYAMAITISIIVLGLIIGWW